MGITRTFADYTPPARFDGKPFTQAKIEEAEARDGTYAEIDTIELDPVDKDPTAPATRSLTTDEGTREPAWYRLTWEDADGDTAVEAPVYVPIPPTWTPELADVAALIRARLKVPGGLPVETFTEETRPTANEARRLILKGVRRVATAIGAEPCTDDLAEDARDAAALYAAMLIEQAYWPEQTSNAGSSFQSLSSLWKDQIKTLTEAVGEQCGGGSGDAVGGKGQMPAYNFDDADLIGRLHGVW